MEEYTVICATCLNKTSLIKIKGINHLFILWVFIEGGNFNILLALKS